MRTHQDPSAEGRKGLCRAVTAARLIVAATTFLLLAGVPAPGASAATPSSARAHNAFGSQGVDAYGDAPALGGFGGDRLSAPVVGISAMPTGQGYRVAAADGGILTYGDAGFYGSLGATDLFAPIVGISTTPDGAGYWLVAMDGGVFTFGDAGFYGSLGARPLNASIVAMAPTPDGRGYWLVGADGGIFTFGDATFLGSMGAQHLASPMAGIAPTSDGQGYWLMAGDGGIFTFGDAGFFGSAAGANIGAGVTGMAPTPDGGGYWLVAATGGVLTFGDAPFEGPNPNPPPFSPTVAMATTPDGGGYWLLRQDEADNVFSNPGPDPSAFPAGGRAVAVAASQIGPDPDSGYGCNPYGPCEDWCSLFATWVWNQVGIGIPRYAFTGYVYDWASANTRVLPPGGRPVPGDGVMYGTGPQSTSTSVHMGIVAQVWPDGSIDTVEGDAGPEPAGHYAVIVNGPFLPSQSAGYNGFGIYAFVQP